MELSTISRKIKAFRMKHLLTQSEMARKHKLSRVNIARWEAGLNYPSMHSLRQLKKKNII
jgi:transcriptional regulator with XRE-family HTH domain